MVKIALRMYEDSLCRCGHSVLLTQAPDALLAYRAKTVTCPACASGERERKRADDPGQMVYVEDLRDTPGAMDPDADDVIWMPDPDDAVAWDAKFSAGDADLGTDCEGIRERSSVHADVVRVSD